MLIPALTRAQINTVTLKPVITGLSSPMQTAHAGDNSHRIFVVEKEGTIKVFDKDYKALGTFLTISGIRTTGEQGLLSMAFDPAYRSNGHFYIYYTASGTANFNNRLILDRYTVSASNSNQANPASRLNILSIDHPATNHNGGKINFGKDGFLYLSTGDSGGGGDPGNVAQNTRSLLGKMLRIDVSITTGTTNYTIPAGNPYNNEIFSTGLRNPFRWNFDRYNNDVYIGDVGQNEREEVSFASSKQLLGANFGWRCYEGRQEYNTSGCASIYQYILPPYDYPLTSSARSVVGGGVYRGYQFPDLKNWYFFIDYFNTNMLMVNRNGDNWTPIVKNTSVNNISDFSESEDGEVLICRNSNSGQVYQLVASNPRTVYVFSGSGNWSNPSNWKNRQIPPNPLPVGADIVVKPYVNGVCTLDVAQIVPFGNNLFLEPGSKFELSKNLDMGKVKELVRRMRKF